MVCCQPSEHSELLKLNQEVYLDFLIQKLKCTLIVRRFFISAFNITVIKIYCIMYRDSR